METIVINLLGGPGVGKSTTMAGIFNALKNKDIECEMVTEFAKDLVWEDRKETFKDELYIFAKQAHRLFRVKGKVQVVVTDRPLILTTFYAKSNTTLCKLCVETFNEYNNLNYLLVRTKKYHPNGRNQTEDEAKAIDVAVKTDLEAMNIPYEEVDISAAVEEIVKKVEKAIYNLK